MLLNGKSWILVQHPKLVKEPEQVTVEWLYRQIEKMNDGKWLVEGFGGLQPLIEMTQTNVYGIELVSILTKHSQLIHTHPDNKIMCFKTESAISLDDAVSNNAVIIRRRCTEGISLYVDLWEIDQVIDSTREFFTNHLFYQITGPDMLFVDSCLMENKSYNEEI